MTRPRQLYRRLLRTYGPQGWWPADDPFEIIAGAVLVQRTAWRNAALAIESLRRERLLDPDRMARADERRLADSIRPAGFWRIKSARLQSVSRAVSSAGGIAKLGQRSTAELRDFFLGVKGIGEETADVVLLYAFERPAVVIDAYLRRLIARIEGQTTERTRSADRRLRSLVSVSLTEVGELNDWHALVVEHCKIRCRARPACENCCLRKMCRTGLEASESTL